MTFYGVDEMRQIFLGVRESFVLFVFLRSDTQSNVVNILRLHGDFCVCLECLQQRFQVCYNILQAMHFQSRSGLITVHSRVGGGVKPHLHPILLPQVSGKGPWTSHWGTPHWNSRASSCYAAGSMHFAFKQEDFFVYITFTY